MMSTAGKYNIKAVMIYISHGYFNILYHMSVYYAYYIPIKCYYYSYIVVVHVM